MTHGSMRTLHATRPVETVTDQLEKPNNDTRSYRLIRLPNDMRALLVHDPEADKASASLCVHVGCFSDEEDMPGTAHAVEHTLFMGSSKFPTENAYPRYLAGHAGRHNADTAPTTTTFWFEVAAEFIDDQQPAPLEGALDRFSAFFKGPLFSKSTLDREICAVDSEFHKYDRNDLRRLNQLDKSRSNPRHPFCRFPTGNLETLRNIPETRGVDVRAKIMEFYDKHYSANRMKLVVLGRETLNILEQWVAKYFSPIPNKDLVPNNWDEVPFRQSELCVQVFAKPVKDIRKLTLIFPFPNQEQMPASQAGQYVTHLLGHEAPGSIMAYLHEKGWVEGLTACFHPTCSGYVSLLYLWVNLEGEGLKNYKEVVKVIFQYVSLLREESPQEWIFQELRSMADVNFWWQEKTSEFQFTKETSLNMQRPLPPNRLLSRPSRPRNFDAPSIEEALACLRPDNFRLTIVSQTFPGDWDQEETWYGTQYRAEKIPEDFMAEILKAASTASKRIPGLHLPEKNPYVPTNLNILNRDVKKSNLAPHLFREDVMLAWFKQDDTFKAPKAYVFINFCNPIVYSTAANAVMALLLVNLVKDALQSSTYYAELAGLQYSLERGALGMCLTLYGYNDKLPYYLQQVLTKMKNLEIKDERFSIICDSLTRFYNNLELSEPYSQVSNYTTCLNSKCDFTIEELLAEVPRITAESVRQYKENFFSQSHVKFYSLGNLDEKKVRTVTDMVHAEISPSHPPPCRRPVDRSLNIPSGSNNVYKKTLKDLEDSNNCIEFWLYTGKQEDRLTRVKTMLFRQMCHESAFDHLRTKEQLGYVLICEAKSASGNYGFSLIIQSARTPEYLDGQVDDFLDSFSLKLENMSDTDFRDHKRSLRVKLLEKSKNLGEESKKHWEQIVTGYQDFEQGAKDAEESEKLTKSDMMEFFRKHIKPGSETRAKLVVYLQASPRSLAAKTVGSAEGVESEDRAPKPVCIEDINEFREALLARGDREA